MKTAKLGVLALFLLLSACATTTYQTPTTELYINIEELNCYEYE